MVPRCTRDFYVYREVLQSTPLRLTPLPYFKGIYPQGIASNGIPHRSSVGVSGNADARALAVKEALLTKDIRGNTVQVYPLHC